MKSIITSDWHVEDSAIPELEGILDEIYFSNPKLKNVKEAWILGDIFDKKRPTAAEIKFVTLAVTKLRNIFDVVNVIVGNHEEVKINELSLLDWLPYLSNKECRICVFREYTMNNVYFGHKLTTKSKHGQFANRAVNADKWSQKYFLSFLGDEHSYSIINENIIHPGSIRYIGFGEVKDENKHYLLFKPKKMGVKPIPIKSCIPMFQTSNIERLTSLPSRMKVRLVVRDFNHFKKVINRIPEFNKKFHTFKIKTDFESISLEERTPHHKIESLRKALNKFLNENEVDEEIEKILKEELK